MSKCPSCGEDRWIMVTKKLPNHPFNVHFIECDACHVVLSASEAPYQFNTFFEPLARTVKRIAEKLGVKSDV